MFAVRIVKIEHYLTTPVRDLDVCYSEFRNCQLSQVPVVRIFGCTPAGQRTCVHLHGIFPYIYIPYNGATPVDQYMHQLAVSLDHALMTDNSKSVTGVQFIYKIELVSGTPFYGYHAKEHQFLKIYFLNPQIVERAVELLQNGAIMNQIFQAHEAHIPFVLQMSVDYNLYGMNLIKFNSIKFRRKSALLCNDSPNTSRTYSLLTNENSDDNVMFLRIWNLDHIPSSMFTNESITKQSTCELEVDALATDIINTLELTDVEMNPGIEAIWEDERWRRRRINDSSQFTPCSSQDRQPFEITPTELQYLEKIKNKLHADSTSQDDSFLEENQEHCKSGKEANSFSTDSLKNLGGDSELSPLILNLSPLYFSHKMSNGSELSQNSDKDFLELLMGMAETESESDSPLSPASCESDFENGDEFSMSQPVYYTEPDSDVPVPHIVNRSNSFTRSLFGSTIPQVDGPPDLPEKGSRKGSTRCKKSDYEAPLERPCSFSAKLSTDDFASSSVSRLEDISEADGLSKELDSPNISLKMLQCQLSDSCVPSSPSRTSKEESSKLSSSDTLVPDTSISEVGSILKSHNQDKENSKYSSEELTSKSNEVPTQGHAVDVLEVVQAALDDHDKNESSKRTSRRRRGRLRLTRVKASYRKSVEKRNCDERPFGAADINSEKGIIKNDVLFSEASTSESTNDYLHLNHTRLQLTDDVVQNRLRSSVRNGRSSNTLVKSTSNQQSFPVNESAISEMPSSTCNEQFSDSGGLERVPQKFRRQRRSRLSRQALQIKSNSRNTSITIDSTSQPHSDENHAFSKREIHDVENSCKLTPQHDQCGARSCAVTYSENVLLQVQTQVTCDEEPYLVASDKHPSKVTKLRSRFSDKKRQLATPYENVATRRSTRSQRKNSPAPNKNRCRVVNLKREGLEDSRSLAPDPPQNNTHLKRAKRKTFCRAAGNVHKGAVQKAEMMPDYLKDSESVSKHEDSRRIWSRRRVVTPKEAGIFPCIEQNNGSEVQAVSRSTSTSNCEASQTASTLSRNSKTAGSKFHMCESSLTSSTLDDNGLLTGSSTGEIGSISSGDVITDAKEILSTIERDPSNENPQEIPPERLEKVSLSNCESPSSLRGNRRHADRLRKSRKSPSCNDKPPLSLHKLSVDEKQDDMLKSDVQEATLNPGCQVKFSSLRKSSRLRRQCDASSTPLRCGCHKDKKCPNCLNGAVSTMDSNSLKPDSDHLPTHVVPAVSRNGEETPHMHQNSDSSNCSSNHNDNLNNQDSSDLFHTENNVSSSREAQTNEDLKSEAAHNDSPSSGLRRNSRKRSVRFPPDPFKAWRSGRPASSFVDCSNIVQHNDLQNSAPAIHNVTDTLKETSADFESSRVQQTVESLNEVLQVTASEDLNNIKVDEVESKGPVEESLAPLENASDETLQLTNVSKLQMKSTRFSWQRGYRRRGYRNKRRSHLGRRPKESYCLPQCGKTPSRAIESLQGDPNDSENFKMQPKNKSDYSFVVDYKNTPHATEQEAELECQCPTQHLEGKPCNDNKNVFEERDNGLSNIVTHFENCSVQNSVNQTDSETQVTNDYLTNPRTCRTEPASTKDGQNADLDITANVEDNACNTRISSGDAVPEESFALPSSEVCELEKNRSYRGRGRGRRKVDRSTTNAKTAPALSESSWLHNDGEPQLDESQAIIDLNRKIQRRSIRFQSNYKKFLDFELFEELSDTSTAMASVKKLDHSVSLSIKSSNRHANTKRGRLSLKHQSHERNIEDNDVGSPNTAGMPLQEDFESDTSTSAVRGRSVKKRLKGGIDVAGKKRKLSVYNLHNTVKASDNGVSKVDDDETFQICVKGVTVSLAPWDIQKKVLEQLGNEIVVISHLSEEMESGKVSEKIDNDENSQSSAVVQRTKWKKILVPSSDEDSLDTPEAAFSPTTEMNEMQETVEEINLEASKLKEGEVSLDTPETVFCPTAIMNEMQERVEEVILEASKIKEESRSPSPLFVPRIIKAKSKCKRVVFSDEDDDIEEQEEEDIEEQEEEDIEEQEEEEEDDSDSLNEYNKPFTRSRGSAPTISSKVKPFRQRRRPKRFLDHDLSAFIVDSSDSSSCYELSSSDSETASSDDSFSDDQETSYSDESCNDYRPRRFLRKNRQKTVLTRNLLKPKKEVSSEDKATEKTNSDNTLDSSVHVSKEDDDLEQNTVLPLGRRKSKRCGVDYNPHAYGFFFKSYASLVNESHQFANSNRRQRKSINSGPKVLSSDLPITLNPYVKMSKLTDADIEKHQKIQRTNIEELQVALSDGWEHLSAFWKDKELIEDSNILELPKVTEDGDNESDYAFSIGNGGEPFDYSCTDDDFEATAVSNTLVATVEDTAELDVTKKVDDATSLRVDDISNYLPDFSDEEQDSALNEHQEIILTEKEDATVRNEQGITFNEDEERYGGYEDALQKLSFPSPIPDVNELSLSPPRCDSPSGSLTDARNEDGSSVIVSKQPCDLFKGGDDPPLESVNGMSLGTIEDLFNSGLSEKFKSTPRRGRNVARRGRPWRGRPWSRSTYMRKRVPVNRFASEVPACKEKSRGRSRGRPRGGRKANIRLGSINPKPYQLLKEALPKIPPPLQIVIKEHNRNSHRNEGLTVESIRQGEKKSKKKPLTTLLSSNPDVEPRCGKLLAKMLNGLNSDGASLSGNDTIACSSQQSGYLNRFLKLEERNAISALHLRRLLKSRRRQQPRKKKDPKPPKVDVTTVLAQVPVVEGEHWKFPGLETGASWSFGLTYSNSHVKRYAPPVTRMPIPVMGGESQPFLNPFGGVTGNWMQSGQTGPSWLPNTSTSEYQQNPGENDTNNSMTNMSQSIFSSEQPDSGMASQMEDDSAGNSVHDDRVTTQPSNLQFPTANKFPIGLANSGLPDADGSSIDWKTAFEAGEENMWMAFGSHCSAAGIQLKKGQEKSHFKNVDISPSSEGVQRSSGVVTDLTDNPSASNELLPPQFLKSGCGGSLTNVQRSFFTHKSMQSSQMTRSKNSVESDCNVNQNILVSSKREELNEPFVVPTTQRPPVPDTPVCDFTLSPRQYAGDKSPEMFDCWDDIQPPGNFQDLTFTYQAPPVYNDNFLKPADKSSDPVQTSKATSQVVKTRVPGVQSSSAIANDQTSSTEKVTRETKNISDSSAKCIAEFSDDQDDNIGPSGDIIKTLERVVEGLNFKIGEPQDKATKDECGPAQTSVPQLNEVSKKGETSLHPDRGSEITLIELVGSSFKKGPDNDITFKGSSISQAVEGVRPLTPCNVASYDRQCCLSQPQPTDKEMEPLPTLESNSSCNQVESTGESNDDSDLNLTPIHSFYLYGDEQAPWSSATVAQDNNVEPKLDDNNGTTSSIDLEQSDNLKSNSSTQHLRGDVSISNCSILTYVFAPPSPKAIKNSLTNYGIPEVRYPVAHCSNVSDLPKKPLQLGGGAIVLKIASKSLSELQEYHSDLCVTGLCHWKQVIRVVEENGSVCTSGCDVELTTKRKPLSYRGLSFEFWPRPPSLLSVRKWLCNDCGTVIEDSPCATKNITAKYVPKKSPFGNPILRRKNSRNELLFPAVMENDFERSILPLVPVKSNSITPHSTPNVSCFAKISKMRLKHTLEFAVGLWDLPQNEEPFCLAVDTVVGNELITPTKTGRRSNEFPVPRSPRLSSAFLTPKKGSPKSLLTQETPLIRRKLFGQKLKAALRTVDGRKSLPSTSQLDGPSPQNTYGFKMSAESLNVAKQLHMHQYLTLMSLELHVRTDGDLCPNPKLNPICAIFYHVTVDAPAGHGEIETTGIMVVEDTSGSTIAGIELSNTPQQPLNGSEPYCWKYLQVSEGVKLTFVGDEFTLIQELIKVVQFHDPDIILGYEVEMYSWGFLLERASVLGLKLCPSLSRIPDDSMNIFHPPQEGRSDSFVLNVSGRIVLNVWEILKHEVSLYGYTFENVAYHVLHRRLPLFSFRTLTSWFDRLPHVNRWRTLQHYLIRVKGNIQLLERLDLIGRTSELARLFGIQFYEVFSRGSQFRVESMMLRLCRQRRLVAVSPSVQQRASMNAPEYIPLIMEPESKFYTSPVVVLDFQSLYPSMVIAYNYCFSTCLGKVDNIGQSEASKFGCTSLKVPSGLLMKLKDKLTVSPCGVAFVKPEVRKGVLPRMLEEILTARIMVKTAMKKYKNDKALYRVLDSRQLGLKLIANVTYGYTAANFSGRMPCVEIADSIVSKGRETLERAIELIHNTSKWKAKVVYGDTDSVFVLLEGRTKEQAFAIGQEIVQAVTAVNPKPVKLKLEKVYLPCVLQTKKRYVGFMFESADQKEPKYEAKGIETVRRDGCPAVAKILEKSLKILFTTYDVSQVKTYVQHQFSKILMGRVTLDNYTFTRKYRGRNGYHLEAHAPALKIAKQLLRHDPRSEPRLGERVPYVIVYGSPGSSLIQLVCHPQEVLQNTSMRLNSQYYICNAICPPLNRVFLLLGVNVDQWFSTLPRKTRFMLPQDNRLQVGNSISRYFLVANCPVCDTESQGGICLNCLTNPQKSAIILMDRIRKWERRYYNIAKVCYGCANTPDPHLSCVSLDCPILFRLAQATRDLSQAPYLHGVVENFSLTW